LPFQLGKGLLNLPGAIGSGLSRLFTSDPQLANVPVINTGDPILGSGDATADRLPPEVQRMQNVVNQLSVDLADRGHWDPTNFANTGIGGSPEEGFFATVDGGAIDIEGAFDRGGAIRSSDLAGDYGTMNRMINDPRGIASLGRGGDTMLVHMRPDEVAAMSRDGRTTVNPRTGLPERFWGPALGGLAGSFFGPWGVGITDQERNSICSTATRGSSITPSHRKGVSWKRLRKRRWWRPVLTEWRWPIFRKTRKL
jgi:hypothetical protein